MRTSIIPLLFLPVFLANAAVADIVADGGTATTVSQDANGVERVAIAPASADGISHNTYERFNVSRSGAEIDNRAAAARTVVNQVTSTQRSTLEGEIRVLGTRAHVIVANPNGIMVDGARFINTGNVALTTGDVGFVVRQVSGGPNPVNQVNTTVTTSQGRIVIGEGGLSGTMNHLDLIAKDIAIHGEVLVENDSPLSSIRISQGESEYEFDSAVATNNPGNQWAVQTSGSSSAESEFLVDITRNASLRASSIQVVVNDEGAGFRLAGDLLADQNSFTLSSKGEVLIDRGAAQAAGFVAVEAGSLTLRGDDRQGVLKSIGSGTLVTTDGDVRNTGGLIQGNQRIVGLPQSQGGLTLNVGGDLINETQAGKHLGVLFSEADTLQATVGGDVTNTSGRIFSNAGLSFNLGGTFTNQTPVTEFEGRGEVQRKHSFGDRVWYTLFLYKERINEVSIDYGEALIPEQDALVLADGDIEIQAERIDNIGGVVTTPSDGDITLVADRVLNQQRLTGHVYYKVTCAIVCDREATSSVQSHGGQINAGDELTVIARESVRNIGGDFIARNNMVIDSPYVRAEAIDNYTAIQRSSGLRGFFRLDDAKLARADQGGSFISNMGKITFNTYQPVEIVGGVVEAPEGVETGYSYIDYIREKDSGNPFLKPHIGVFEGIL